MRKEDSKAKRRTETVSVTILILLLGFGATVTKLQTLKVVTGKYSALVSFSTFICILSTVAFVESR